LLTAFLLTAVVIGAGLSWFASTNPDGLEWSIARVTGSETLGVRDGSVNESLGDVQEKTSLLPDYGFREDGSQDLTERAGTSASGILGGILTLLLAGSAGVLLRWRRSRA
jgi:cobalt/nickel transport system permease protein